MSVTLDLMRHGEPVGGRKYRGQIDDPLSEKGWAQMQAAVGDAAPWTRIVSSPLLRCRAFAEALAGRHELPLILDDRLREVGFGIWEGKSAAEIELEAPGTLARFKADPANRGKVMSRGFWRYTRHPNYFGDAVVWWGLFCFAAATGGWWTVYGPVLMTVLLMRVSGVALLEKRLRETKPAYRDYVERTNAFFPWFPAPGGGS